MPGEYYLEFRDALTGARTAIVTGATGGAARNGFLSLNGTRKVNAPSLWVIDLPADHPLLPVADKSHVWIYRRDVPRGIDWYVEDVAIVRDDRYTSQSGERGVRLTAPGLLSLLSWYHILWPANVSNRTVFTSQRVETIMKTLVTYNATTSATTGAGRDRNAMVTGITVEADGSRGNIIPWTTGRSKTLLGELQALAAIGGGDFDLVATGPTTREFRWYTNQRGSDKSGTITFAESLGNIDNITFERVRSSERSVAVVGGQGTEAARDTVTRTGANYTSLNAIEVFVDARDVAKGDTTTLQTRGDRKLDELQAREVLEFDVIQTNNAYYGPSGNGSYTLGDVVSAIRPDGVAIVQQVAEVSLAWSANGAEQIGVRLATQ